MNDHTYTWPLVLIGMLGASFGLLCIFAPQFVALGLAVLLVYGVVQLLWN